MRAFSRLFLLACPLLTAVLPLAAPAPAVAGGNQVTPILIGDHELVVEFAVGDGCDRANTPENRDGFKGLSDCYEGDLYLIFDEPAALVVDSLIITVDAIDPDDPNILSRLPSSSTFIPTDFPVLIRIVDDGTDGFTFSNRWEMEIETRELAFNDRSPLRLFRAEEGCPAPGCPFEDATFSSGFGSYHVRGSFGTFSEFVVAADMRPTRSVVASKISSLSLQVDEYVNDGEISAPIGVSLQAELTSALTALGQQDLDTAFFHLINFVILVEINAGNGISAIWDPDEGLESAAGVLLGGGESAIFSIETAARPQALSVAGLTKNLVTDPTGYRAEVTIDFDETTDFQPDGFYIDAFEVDPFDPALLNRLPNNVSIDPAFPVLIQIGADASNRPAARGDWEVTVRTRDISFQNGTSYRLFKATTNGDFFVDVTDQLGVGSLVARGAVAEFDQFAFSEYLLVRDGRPANGVVAAKFLNLETYLGNQQIDSQLKSQLLSELDSAKNAALAGNFDSAIDLLDVFRATVDLNAGVLLPDIWRADDVRANQGGTLEARAKSLQFSLAIEETPLEADPADVNRDGVVNAADVFAAIERVYCPTGCTQQPLVPSPAPKGLSPAPAAVPEQP